MLNGNRSLPKTKGHTCLCICLSKSNVPHRTSTNPYTADQVGTIFQLNKRLSFWALSPPSRQSQNRSIRAISASEILSVNGDVQSDWGRSQREWKSNCVLLVKKKRKCKKSKCTLKGQRTLSCWGIWAQWGEEGAELLQLMREKQFTRKDCKRKHTCCTNSICSLQTPA